jgi:nucleoside-diphosphate-sugar epimerase
MKKIFLIGGAGYVGTELVPMLIHRGYQVTVYDLMIYGSNFDANKNLNVIKGDVRDIKNLGEKIKGHDYVIHLACISNDPSFELNPKLGKEINYDCFQPLVKISKELGVKHFIYASSSSVYGIKDSDNVNEESSLEPITDYSKFKMDCEKILLDHVNSNFISTIIRPATVCGYSKRQRLDLVVNILTNLGYHTGEIKVFGGKQLRPNIHIHDMCRSYIEVIETEINKIENQIFNVGFENHSVEKLAQMVRDNLENEVNIRYVETNDERSYHISSEKIQKQIGFKPEKNINDAIKDLIKAFDRKEFSKTLENEDYFNIKRMQSINLK